MNNLSRTSSREPILPPRRRDGYNAGMSEREKPTAGFWIAVALVASPVLYVLSLGPLQWLWWNGWLPIGIVPLLEWTYFPIEWLSFNGSQSIRDTLDWYVKLWNP